jgi:hypothetical protein
MRIRFVDEDQYEKLMTIIRRLQDDELTRQEGHKLWMVMTEIENQYHDNLNAPHLR